MREALVPYSVSQNRPPRNQARGIIQLAIKIGAYNEASAQSRMRSSQKLKKCQVPKQIIKMNGIRTSAPKSSRSSSNGANAAKSRP